eukprot:scaffold90084_cov19-Tisochrysis_lutea.AAC.1
MKRKAFLKPSWQHGDLWNFRGMCAACACFWDPLQAMTHYCSCLVLESKILIWYTLMSKAQVQGPAQICLCSMLEQVQTRAPCQPAGPSPPPKQHHLIPNFAPAGQLPQIVRWVNVPSPPSALLHSPSGAHKTPPPD